LLKKNNNLRFKDLYSNLCLHFLNKTKRIILFNVKVENRNIECIKIINNINDIITKKDIVRIQIRITLNNISKKIDNIQKEIGKCMLNAKNCLRNKNKQQARTFLLKKKTLEKTLNMYYNQQNTIENQLNDLNSMEDNLKNLNIIQDAIEVGKQIGLKAEDYDEVASDFKEQNDNYNDIHDMIKEMGNNNVNEEDINKELNDLLNENDNNDRGGGQLFDFPDVNNEIPNKKEEEKFENLIN
jgi:charged multivesicular body protein 4